MKLERVRAAISAYIGSGTYEGMRRPFLILCLLYVLALFALLRANYSYADDMNRAVLGNHGWLDWSRYVTTALSFVMHLTPKLTDISPLPQLLAAGLMAFSGLLVIHVFTGKKEIGWPLLLAALPMGLSPWFLECFSYKFDAPYMAVSVLASVLPFQWWERDRRKFLITSFLGLLVMTMSYQASSGIFVIEALFLAFLSWARGGRAKDISLWLLLAAAVYVLSLLIFKLFFMRPPVDAYVSIGVAALPELPQTLLQNGAAYLSLAWRDLNWIEQAFAALATGLFLLHGIRGSKRNPLVTLLLLLLLLAVTLPLSYGAYLVLEKPLLFPRGMLGMGFWMSFLLISLLTMAEKKGVARWAVLLLVWQLIAGAAAYGDALAEQKRYTDFRIRLLVQDLNTLGLTENMAIQYYLSGDIGIAPMARNTETEYPVVKRLMVPTFSDTNTLTILYFYTYHDLAPHVNPDRDPTPHRGLPTVLENRYHRVQTDGKDVLIVLKASRYE